MFEQGILVTVGIEASIEILRQVQRPQSSSPKAFQRHLYYGNKTYASSNKEEKTNGGGETTKGAREMDALSLCQDIQKCSG